jgi:hypothetical protein
VIALVFVGAMCTLGYVVTRYPELLTRDTLAVVDGVAATLQTTSCGFEDTGAPN